MFRLPSDPTVGRYFKFLVKIQHALFLIIAIKMFSGCFAFRPFTPEDQFNKKQFKKLPASEIVFVAKYVGTQTGTQMYFRKDGIFTLQTQTAFGWEQYNGNYSRMEASDTFSLTYFNEHIARWKYVVINKDKALFKVELNDTAPKQGKSFQIVLNAMTK
jgi:hypothetical protein